MRREEAIFPIGILKLQQVFVSIGHEQTINTSLRIKRHHDLMGFLAP